MAVAPLRVKSHSTGKSRSAGGGGARATIEIALLHNCHWLVVSRNCRGAWFLGDFGRPQIDVQDGQ